MDIRMKKGIPGISQDTLYPPMLKQLRIKFIVINMLLAIIVLGLAFASVCYADYSSRTNAVYSELSYVVSEAASGRVPMITTTQKLTLKDPSAALSSGTKAQSPSSSSQTYSKQSTGASSSRPTIGINRGSDGSIILAAVYSVKPDGMYTVINDYSNASIPESMILTANDDALASKSDHGYISEYDLFFTKKVSETTPGEYVIGYADGASVGEWKSLAFILGVACGAGLIVLFIINIFFSKWAIRPVQVSFKQQQQFTADASHELKTPLTVILANMAILKSEPDAPIASQMQWIESTQTEAERMQLLVNDMLALSKPEQMKHDLIKEDVDFSDLVEGEVLQFESVAFELDVELEEDVVENLHVLGDPERLGRMVATLIDNACKYSAKGDNDQDAPDCEFGKVDVRLRKKPSPSSTHVRCELSVHNNGPCIPEDDLPYIFTRFYRADKVRTSSKGGYGLGLAICQEIVHEHNGNITVSSSPSEGTTFVVTLPLID